MNGIGDRRRLTIDDVFDVRTLEYGGSTVSPDGTRLAFVTARAGDVWAGALSGFGGDAPTAPGARLHVTTVADGDTTDLSGDVGSSWAPSWSPDGSKLVFCSDRTGTAALWCWTAEWGDVRQVSSVPLADSYARGAFGASPVEWAADSGAVYVPVRAAANAETDNAATPPEGVDVRVFSSPADPTGATDAPLLWEVHEVDLRSGRSEQVLRALDVGSYSLSPDGSRFAIVAPPRRRHGLDVADPGFPAAIVAVAGGEPAWIEGGLRGHQMPAWSPDSRHVAFTGADGVTVVDAETADARQLSVPATLIPGVRWHPASDVLLASEQESVGEVPLPGGLWAVPLEGDPTRLDLPPGRSLPEVVERGRAFLSPDGASCVVICQEHERRWSEIWRVPLDGGRPVRVAEGARTYAHAAGVIDDPAGSVVMTVDDEATPPDWWVTDAGFARWRRLTNLNRHLDDVELGRSRIISWLGPHGEDLKGAVLLPPDYVDGRIPVVVHLYPMEQSTAAHRWDAGAGIVPLQLLAAHGFGVFLPDVKTPYISFPPLGGVAPYVLPGVNELIRLGIADGDRLGVMGHSGGGVAVNQIVTQTTRFRAAVSAAGVADMTSFHGEVIALPTGEPYSHGTHMTEQMFGGPPWQHPLGYITESAIYRVHRIETPLLLIHGVDDPGASVRQAEQLFTELNRLGKAAVLACYAGEGHVPGRFRPSARRDVYDRVLDWFGRHLSHKSSTLQD